MLSKLIIQIIIGILGLWLADTFIPGVSFNGPFFLIPRVWTDILKTMVFWGAFLGTLNFFVKPVLNIISLPLRIITLNLFSLVIAMALVWLVDILSMELNFSGITPLFWTTLIIWGISLFFPYKKKWKRKTKNNNLWFPLRPAKLDSAGPWLIFKKLMKTFLPIIQIAVSVILIVAILLQQRGTALGSAFGGESGGFYATRRGVQEKIFWVTIALGALFIILSLLNLFF